MWIQLIDTFCVCVWFIETNWEWNQQFIAKDQSTRTREDKFTWTKQRIISTKQKIAWRKEKIVCNRLKANTIFISNLIFMFNPLSLSHTHTSIWILCECSTYIQQWSTLNNSLSIDELEAIETKLKSLLKETRKLKVTRNIHSSHNTSLHLNIYILMICVCGLLICVWCGIWIHLSMFFHLLKHTTI